MRAGCTGNDMGHADTLAGQLVGAKMLRLSSMLGALPAWQLDS